MAAKRTTAAKNPTAETLRKRQWPKGVPMPKIGAYSARKIWDLEEDGKLRTFYNQYGIAYCARLLGRSMYAVKLRASRLGIAALLTEWSARDDAYLRRWYPRRTPVEIGAAIGRTVVATRRRVRELGLTPQKFWSSKQMALLRKHYGTMKNEELALLIGRSLNAVRAMAHSRGLSTSVRKEITPRQEMAIVAMVGSVSFNAIAKEFGITSQRVSKIAREHGHVPGSIHLERWSDDDANFLRDNYATMPMPDIARHVGRSRDAAYMYARTIGLTPRDSYYGRTKRWTPDEDRQLRKLFGTMTRREVGQRIGRTPLSIKKRAAMLGLSAREKE